MTKIAPKEAFERAVKAVRLEATDIVPRAEWPAFSREVMRALTGLSKTSSGGRHIALACWKWTRRKKKDEGASEWGWGQTGWAKHGATHGAGYFKDVRMWSSSSPKSWNTAPKRSWPKSSRGCSKRPRRGWATRL